MPYTPPSQRSPASSTSHSPNVSRRSSYQAGTPRGSPTANVVKAELPRSASYLTRHRRTSSLKTNSPLDPTLGPAPTGTADQEDGTSGMNAHGSLKPSPSPVTHDQQVPAGAVISPPDSSSNSSDDECPEVESRGRKLGNLAELQAAIRTIEQHRESSPSQVAADMSKANQSLALIMPNDVDAVKPIISRIEDLKLSGIQRKMGHSRSSTDGAVFIAGFRRSRTPDTPLIGSDDESMSDYDDESMPLGKPPMLRKKSGELVRPALRPPSARRRPSSMPGTPTFSKAVHFDSHLEHVRHFLQVDRPLAVSAGSSPVAAAYDSDTEFPFGDVESQTPSPEWEIVVSNFPAETPLRLSLPVRVERVFLSSDSKTLVGVIAVANLAFKKSVVARFTLDYWKTTSEIVAEYNQDVRQPRYDGYDRFNFNIRLADLANLESKTMFFCVKYSVNGQDYWDNNNSTNFQVDFRKKNTIPQNGASTSVSSLGSLPRSSSKRTAPGRRPKSMPVGFDDFADGFDAKYRFDDYRQPINNYVGESTNPVRLKGVRSAVNFGPDPITRRLGSPNGHVFGNRYDFGASLSAAINAANTNINERHGVSLTVPTAAKNPEDARDISESAQTSPRSMSYSESTKTPATAIQDGTSSPRPTGAEKPRIASQSYNELLDKYCFFGSVKSSPQLKDSGLRTGHQYDGSNESGYPFDSRRSTASNSPSFAMTSQHPSSTLHDHKVKGSTSPAPMTDLAPGMSPMYYNLHLSFPFHDAHARTAIRG